jgi:RHS repeat-associated protein
VRYPLGDALRDVRYDEASRIVSFTHLSADGTAQPALDQVFGYDENSRLTSITTNAASWAINYDANGNRTGLSLNGSPSTYSVEATSNRTTSITNPARSLVFDSAGNTLSDSAADGSGYTATYNLRGQLATITKNGVTTRYTYNAAGQRVRKVSGAGPQSTVIFVYDQAGHLLGEYDQNGAALREYVWLRDTPMAVFTPDPAIADPASGEPLVYFIHTDHLNTPRVVVDRQNRVRWRWLAEPFGTTAPETNPSGLGVFTQNLRFPGQYADQESGLWYNYFRNYDSSKGGYTQSDPAGLVGGLNTYAYVDGNPLSFVDPQGLWLQGIPPLVEAGAALLTRQLIARAAARAAAESAARMAAMRFLTVGAATAGALSQTTAERQCGGNLYRAMTPAADGFPLIAPTARGLGVRPETDIAISQDGLVYPGTGGMSVSPTIAGLPPHRRPQDLGGTGKDPVYCTCVADLPDSLVYRPDPLNPTGHGFVEPATPTPFDFYQENIGSTRPFWRRTK